MNWKAYVKQEGESEKGKLKKRLLEWGASIELYERKQAELRRVDRLKEEQKKIWGNHDAEAYKGFLAEIEEKYEEEMKRIRGEIAEILKKKMEMDRMILQLEPEEQQFIELRYKKGYGFDYIGMKMFISRATLFRMQDRILKKLGEMEVETP